MTDGENSNSMQRMAENMSEEHQAYTICFHAFSERYQPLTVRLTVSPFYSTPIHAKLASQLV